MSERTTIRLSAAMLGLVLFAAWGEAVAEVAAVTDRRGQYLGTQVVAMDLGSVDGVWTVRSSNKRTRVVVLNPDGDRHGDLWPLVVESPDASRHPWVLWSRSTGSDFDLAWANWTGSGWSPVRWVEDESHPDDDLDVALDFDASGRPYIVWARQGPQGSSVLLSVFLANRWMAPYRVSGPLVDGRSPEIQVADNGELLVRYDTPSGRVLQVVVFAAPVTITDDINPQTHMSLKGQPVFVQEH